MGLSMTHGIVKHYGGTNEVASTPIEGTIFIVYLPQCEIS